MFTRGLDSVPSRATTSSYIQLVDWWHLLYNYMQVLRNVVQAFKLLAEAPAAPVSAGMDLLNAHREQVRLPTMPPLSPPLLR